MFKKFCKILIRYFTIIIPRKKNIVIFGSWFGKKFSDNSKYLYLSMQKNKNLRAIWITNEDKVKREIESLGYEVYKSNTFKGCFYQLIGATYFTTTGKEDVRYWLMGGAKHVELWHGLPIKKIFYDTIEKKNNKIKSILNLYFENKSFVISTSQRINEIYQHAFMKKKKNILMLGQPRNDVFWSDDIESNKTLNEIENKKIILYMPTHRNEGKVNIDIRNIIDLEKIDYICNKYNYLFVIKKHFYHSNESENFLEYKNIFDISKRDIDAQILLKNTNILITDYSSCFIDFLLLDRPIIFYNYDIEKYLLNDREMYFNYDEITPGVKVNEEEKLSDILESTILGVDLYSKNRKEICNLFYSEENRGIVSENIIKHLF